MLSYQHLYHAGNMADVHKHALLAHVLDYLCQKNKPLSYIETHAGRGVYDLDSEAARKTGEAAAGIAALQDRLPAEHPYRRLLAATRERFGAAAYPGSPLIAALALRPGDSLHLAELHPQEYRALADTMRPFGAHLHRADGFQQALAICPPTPRRGVLLIDPSYEVKDDYAAIPKHLAAIARKWNVGILMLWYPVLASGAHAPMIDAIEHRFPDAFHHLLRFAAAREGHGMTGSGMVVINPPYGIEAAAAQIDALFDPTP